MQGGSGHGGGGDRPGFIPRAPRFETSATVEIRAGERRLLGETSNLSCSGMLALVPGAPLANGTRLALRLTSGDSVLELAGRVANQTPCDAGKQALGIQFLYDLGRFEEVLRFVEALRQDRSAPAPTALSGSLADVPLDTVLETFAGAAGEGTLVLRRGAESGRVAVRDGTILYAVAGLQTGERALARMFAWTDADFEWTRSTARIETEDPPLPLTSALLLASVQRDELARLDLGGLGPDTTFRVNAPLRESLAGSLDEVARELVANAELGFPVSALVDMAQASDVVVYKTITDLVDAGILGIEA